MRLRRLDGYGKSTKTSSSKCGVMLIEFYNHWRSPLLSGTRSIQSHRANLQPKQFGLQPLDFVQFSHIYGCPAPRALDIHIGELGIPNDFFGLVRASGMNLLEQHIV
jgi:hypothetical protein